VDAVLDASGQSGGRRRTGPAGLTPREIKVLTLIARGASTRQVAHRLSITTNTAETQLQVITHCFLVVASSLIYLTG
jgi:DNA-binding CsgD family transcriptional regulator